MAQILKKFIGNNEVADEKIRLDNADYLRARNAANSGDVNMLRVNSSDAVEFPTFPQVASGSPSNANDLVTKSYADSLSSSSGMYKQAVVVVSKSNLTLSGEQTIDGVLTSASRVLLTGQTTAANNGIYVTAAGSWARSTDADADSEVKSGMQVYVNQGTSYGKTLWVLDTADPITVGSTSLTFLKKTYTSKKENLTLNGTDITNQYKDMSFSAIADSMILSVNGVMQYEGSDYTLSVVSGVTRLTFAGDLATGGAAALVSGDILRVKYEY